MKIRKSANHKILSAIAAIGMLVAGLSAGHCWFFAFHQRKCPAHLIKAD